MMNALRRLACLVSGMLSLAWIAGAAPAKSPAQPELVRQVLAGQRHEARASWWGFDAQDSTVFLQEAINSKVRRLIIDRHPPPG